MQMSDGIGRDLLWKTSNFKYDIQPSLRSVSVSDCGVELPKADFNWRNISYSGSSDCYWRITAVSFETVLQDKWNLQANGGNVRFELTYVMYKCSPVCDEFVEVGNWIIFEKMPDDSDQSRIHPWSDRIPSMLQSCSWRKGQQGKQCFDYIKSIPKLTVRSEIQSR